MRSSTSEDARAADAAERAHLGAGTRVHRATTSASRSRRASVRLRKDVLDQQIRGRDALEGQARATERAPTHATRCAGGIHGACGPTSDRHRVGGSPPPRRPVRGRGLARRRCGAAPRRAGDRGPRSTVRRRGHASRLVARAARRPDRRGARSRRASVAALAPEVRTGYGGILLFGTSAPPSLGATLRRLQADDPPEPRPARDDRRGGRGRPAARQPRRAVPLGAHDGRDHDAERRSPRSARRVGTQLRAAGVTMDLAPVLDVDGRNVEPGAKDPDGYRSFGGSSRRSSPTARRSPRGSQQAQASSRS